jgi:hypothetical protein
MSVTLSVKDILSQHVVLETEGIDRLYLNGYVPKLQMTEGVVGFFRRHRAAKFASSTLMDPMTKQFVNAIEQLARAEDVPLITFAKGERKDDVAAKMRKDFDRDEGVYFIGKAQERATIYRTEKRRYVNSAMTYPWLVRSSGMVNHYYFYIVDRDFGPLFIKFCSYFPFNAKICLNGHEWLKRQLTQRGIAFEALDNGLLSCADPKRAQKLCERLDAAKIDAVFRKWLARLPHPFTGKDRKAGYRYDVSILQAEFSLTMVLDRPLTGRAFFEEVIRENLDLGRPDNVQLIFARKITRQTPGRFRTRVITDGVIPSLHVDYRTAKIKEYFKLGRALRVETTINNPRDFKIGKRLHNLPRLREFGFSANRRMLSVQTVSHDCAIGEDTWNQVVRPIQVGEQRASALRFDDPRVQALFAVLVMFAFQADGFTSSQLRAPLAHLLGIDPDTITRGRMTYDIRRLRLHGILERIEHTHRYRLSSQGLRVAVFFSRAWTRLLRPGLSLMAPTTPASIPLRRAFATLENQIARFSEQQKCAA